MLSITLPPELEDALSQSARALGVTPERLALDSLRESFTPAPPSAPEPACETMHDFLKDYIGVIHSGELVPGGAQMSTDSGKKFAEGMVEKRAQGKL